MNLPEIEPTADELAVARRTAADFRPRNRREQPPPLATQADYQAAVGRLIVRLDRLQDDAQRQIDDLQQRVKVLEDVLGIERLSVEWDR